MTDMPKKNTKPDIEPGLPPPPDHLSEDAKGWWRRIVEGWVIGDDAQLVLAAALTAHDRATAARKLIDAEGLTVTPANGGMPHPHPATRIERDAIKEMRLCFKQLGLEVDASPAGGALDIREARRRW